MEGLTKQNKSLTNCKVCKSSVYCWKHSVINQNYLQLLILELRIKVVNITEAIFHIRWMFVIYEDFFVTEHWMQTEREEEQQSLYLHHKRIWIISSSHCSAGWCWDWGWD